MSVRKAIVFDPEGNLVEIESKLARQRSESVSASTKAQMRAELGTPAGAEGLTPANNLSDLGNVETARTNLDVIRREESYGLAHRENALLFDGLNDSLSMGDQTVMEPGAGEDFAISFDVFFRANPSASEYVYSKKVSSGVGVAAYIDISGRLLADIQDSEGSTSTTADGDSLAGGWHRAMIVFERGGNVTRYVDGEAYGTANSIASRNGSLANAATAYLGRGPTANYFDGEITNFAFWNLAPGSAARSEFFSTGKVPYRYRWGGAVAYTSNFSAGLDGWYGTGTVVAGNVEPVAGQNDNMRATVNTGTGAKLATRGGVLTAGQNNRIDISYYIPSTNTHLDGIWVGDSGGIYALQDNAPAKDTWITKRIDQPASSAALVLRFMDGGADVDDPGGNDVCYWRAVITQPSGAVISLTDRAIQSGGGWDDESDNAIATTTSGAVPWVAPITESGTFTPTISFGGGNTGVDYFRQWGSYEVLPGGLVHFKIELLLNSKGTDAGNLLIEGLPFASKNSNGSDTFAVKLTQGSGSGADLPVGLLPKNSTAIELWGHSTSAFQFTNSEIGASPSFVLSGFYMKA